VRGPLDQKTKKTFCYFYVIRGAFFCTL
jgi:hypothetical protein